MQQAGSKQGEHVMDDKAALQQEWVTLQNNHERYESGSLAIKLVAVVLVCTGVAFELEAWFVGCRRASSRPGRPASGSACCNSRA